ncbi:SUMF1/EgtB/PvdO family nonheme iron enzyme [Buttiauxella selenatireducens]|uniref:SUMF1/EgtB/PvdO family nonheme iron enzyme n=1 Tax=Buttiauxella selenatireducens TaxID=3073902 RepID=A0ABY9SEW9_9ENTR|nr:SUMF1/EgtB/PvdO family nonheme iron enzyme [Buttiauxella sp. R73]WMY76052.1 SUMF1/EgtB/PvdO family nonheme iron enzyme [Buttiauxella sp. R73]
MNKIIIPAFILILSGCDNTSADTVDLTSQQKKELQLFIQKAKSEQIFVQGGTFWMGDFCSKMRSGGSFCTSDKNNKPDHKVELSSYSISKFKITHENYSFYLDITGKPKQNFDNKLRNKTLSDMTFLQNSPAIISWTEASNYCTWLKKETGLPFSLPTEAQWEYAARNRGQYVTIATDDGTLRVNSKTYKGENFATDEDRDEVAEPNGLNPPLVRFPVEKYPASPLGLYNMADNGKEWVVDWYDPDYYVKSPMKDPQGPDKPVVKDKTKGQYWKVLRGASNPVPGFPSGLTITRYYKIKDPDGPLGTTARCVINSAEPIKNQ